MKKLTLLALATLAAASSGFAEYKRGSGDCPALTVEQAITEIAQRTYGPNVEYACFSELLGPRTSCYNSVEKYREVIAQVAATSDFANDEVNMAVYQYARSDIGYGVFVDYRDALCGRFIWDDTPGGFAGYVPESQR